MALVSFYSLVLFTSPHYTKSIHKIIDRLKNDALWCYPAKIITLTSSSAPSSLLLQDVEPKGRLYFMPFDFRNKTSNTYCPNSKKVEKIKMFYESPQKSAPISRIKALGCKAIESFC